MRPKDVLGVVAVLALVAGAAIALVRLQDGKGYSLQEGAPAPAFDLARLDGGNVNSLAYRGRIVVVNFWATWCPPCVAEMPSLERLHRALGPEGLAVVGISVDEDEPALRRFISDYGLTLPILRDPGGRTAAQAYRTTGYPETFVIDADGVLIAKYVGPAEWDTPGSLAHFRSLLSLPRTSPTR